MKTTSSITAMLTALSLIVPLHAGVISEVIVRKNRFFKQTDENTAKLRSANSYPFGFNVGITGDNAAAVIALRPKPTITLPKKSTFAERYNLTPALGPDEERNEWKFGYIGQNPYDNWGTQTLSEMNEILPTGTYVFKIEGKEIDLIFPNSAYPNAPKLILTGGNWSNGSYRLKSNKSLTINSGIYSAYGSNLNDYLYLSMESAATDDEIFEHVQIAKDLAFGPPQSPSKSYSRKITANKLAPGTYYIYAGFGVVSSISKALPKALAISTLETETEVKLVVTAP